MSKHTPGPWFTKREGFSTVYVEARIRHGVIQEVAACGPTEAGQEQQEANARLIAAAPELLKALERIAREHDCGCVPCLGSCRSKEALEITVEEIQEIARAAIAKARVKP